jgi:hypothetical protein
MSTVKLDGIKTGFSTTQCCRCKVGDNSLYLFISHLSMRPVHFGHFRHSQARYALPREVVRIDTSVDYLQGNSGTPLVCYLHQTAQTREHVIAVDAILARCRLTEG